MLKTFTLAALMVVTESIKLEQCCNTCACDNQDHLDNEVVENMVPIIGEIDNIVEVMLNGDEDTAIVEQLPTMVRAVPKLGAAAAPDQAALEQAAAEQAAAEQAALEQAAAEQAALKQAAVEKIAAEKAAAETAAAAAAAAEKTAADAALKKAAEDEATAKKA